MSDLHADERLDRRVSRIGEGRFQLQSELARGGQAEVWRAIEIPDPQRDLAVKLVICDPEKLQEGNPSIENVFHEEAKTWAEFQKSPYVVQLYYSFRDRLALDGKERLALGFVMEFSSEGDLAKHLKSGSLNLGGKKQTRSFLLDIAQALKAGHDKDIVHGDIKARNVILFRQAGALTPKLMDFGMAISTDTSRNRWGGTPEYMAPELFENIRPTKESDVYSLGILFFEIICGKLPYTLLGRDREARWRDYKVVHSQGNADFQLIEGAFDKNLADLVKGMMRTESGARTKLAKVISSLRRQQDEELRTSIRSPETEAVLRPKTYRWNPNVHNLRGNHLFYYFIKGTSPTGDPKWFKNNLLERGIHGYSLYRVLGGYDYILRVWMKHPYEEELALLLRTFRDAHGGDYKSFCVKAIDLFSKVPELTVTKADEILKAIYDCRDRDAKIEYENLRTRGLVSSLFSHQENNPIRLFLTINAGNRPSDFLLRAYAREFSDALRKDATTKDLSVYQGEGDFGLLLKFRLQKFEDFRKIYEVFLATSANVRLSDAPLSSQTYVEMDPVGLIESDDGSIIAELNEYAATEVCEI